jgi:uncharacterized protein (DUF1330 family)
MAAYLLGNFKVTSPEGLITQRELIAMTISDHGGEQVVADVNSFGVEGDAEHLSVVLKFPNIEALQGC